MHTQPSLLVHRIGLPGLDDLINQLRNAQNILVSFRGQTQHKVELHIVPAAGKGIGAGAQDLILCQILVDHIPQALSTGFRRKGQTAFAHGLQLFHQLPGEIIRPQGGYRQIHPVLLAVRNHLIGQFLQPPIIRGGQAGKRDLIVSGRFQRLHRLAVQNLRALLANRAVSKTGLAETAATDAATEHLQIRPVMDDLCRRNDHIRGPVCAVQILNDPLGDLFRRTLQCNDGGQCSVIVVFMAVESGHIYTGDLGDFLQELLLGPALSLRPVIEAHDLHRDLLALTQREEVYKVCQRLGIVSADTAREHNILQPRPILGMKRDPGKLQHIQNIGIAHLIADGEGNHVEVLHGALAFQRPKGQLVGAHSVLHIAPGGKHPLAPNAVHPVHNAIQDPHTHIGHADLIGIRETEGNTHSGLGQIFLDLAPLAAGVPGRLLDSGKDPLQ